MNSVMLSVCLLLSICLNAQVQQFSLDKYVELVQKQNIDIGIATNNEAIGKLSYRQQQLSFMPQLTAGFDHNITFGTVFDNVTFQRVQKTTQNSFPSLTLNVNLFNGLAWHFQRGYARYNYKAALYVNTQKQQEITLAAVQAYFMLLADEAQLSLYTARVKQMDNLLELVRRQYEAGAKNRQDYYLVQSQLEAEQLNLLNVQQQYVSDKYTFLNLARLHYGDSIVLDKLSTATPDIAIPDSSTINRRPALLAAAMRMSAARQLPKAALAGLLPRLNLIAGVASNYSSNGIFDPEQGVVYPSFGQQLKSNFYQYVGLSLQVPLVAAMQNYFNPAIQRHNYFNAQLQYAQAQQQATTEYNTLINNVALVDKKRDVAATKLSAAQEAYRVAQANYNAGAINFYDYILSLNNQTQAELDVLQTDIEKAILGRQVELWK